MALKPPQEEKKDPSNYVLMNAAWWTDAPPGPRDVLIALAMRVNANRKLKPDLARYCAWQGVPTLAREASVCERSVQAHLRWLIEHHYIAKLFEPGWQWKHARQKTAGYVVLLGRLGERAPPEQMGEFWWDSLQEARARQAKHLANWKQKNTPAPSDDCDD